jgi:hypothetical protein
MMLNRGLWMSMMRTTMASTELKPKECQWVAVPSEHDCVAAN